MSKRITQIRTDHQVPGMIGRMKPGLFLIMVCVLLYGNTLFNGFVFDDQVMITNNKLVTQGISAIPELMSTPHQLGYAVIHNDEYRPLSLVLFSVIYQFFELNPVPYHLLNILLFAAGVLLLFRFFAKMLGSNRMVTAFIAALLFAVHPIHTEVVANVKSCDELLCFVLAMGSLHFFVSYMEQDKLLLLLSGLVCFFLSLLAKETSVTFNAIIPFVLLLYANGHRKVVVVSVSLIAVAGLFLLVRHNILVAHHAYNPDNINIIENALAKKGLPFETKLATAILILGYYLKLLFVPYPLVCDYSVNTIHFTSFGDPVVLLTLIVYLFLVGSMAYRLTRYRKDGVATGIFFYLATIVLFSNFFIMIKATLGERFLYFPSIGYCLVIAVLLEKWGGNSPTFRSFFGRTKVAAVLIPLLLMYSGVTIARNTDWKDEDTLFGVDAQKVPENARLQFFIGYNMFVAAKKELNPDAGRNLAIRSLDHLSNAARLCPDYFFIETNLGGAFFYLNMFDSAEVHDKRAIELEPEDVNGANNLSAVSIRLGKYRQGIEVCRNSLRWDSHNIIAYVNLGVCYYKLNQFDSSAYYLYKAIETDPKVEASYSIMARVYQGKGIPDSARKYELITRQFNPGFHLK